MPILLKFAESRRQLTKISLKLMQLPRRMTENKCVIAHYLTVSILNNRTKLSNAIKKEHNVYKRKPATDADKTKATDAVKKARSFKLKINTILEKTNINDPKHKSHEIETIEAILSYYIKCRFIQSYSFSNNNCIEILLINETDNDETNMTRIMVEICKFNNNIDNIT